MMTEKDREFAEAMFNLIPRHHKSPEDSTLAEIENHIATHSDAAHWQEECEDRAALLAKVKEQEHEIESLREERNMMANLEGDIRYQL